MSAAVETTAEAVGEFLDLMEPLGIRVWLDGGWAVDGCLGAQTRRHDDLDFHVITVDRDGNGVYGPPELGLRYPAEALTGLGEIAGRAVACITPRWLVAFHTGYAVDATDWADVSALCNRFGIPIPDDYLPFRSRPG